MRRWCAEIVCWWEMRCRRRSARAQIHVKVNKFKVGNDFFCSSTNSGCCVHGFSSNHNDVKSGSLRRWRISRRSLISFLRTYSSRRRRHHAKSFKVRILFILKRHDIVNNKTRQWVRWRKTSRRNSHVPERSQKSSKTLRRRNPHCAHTPFAYRRSIDCYSKHTTLKDCKYWPTQKAATRAFAQRERRRRHGLFVRSLRRTTLANQGDKAKC